MRKGWFAIEGFQVGDRTLEDQVAAVRPVFAEMAGAQVLDLGCAEGLITRECARAGAALVRGIDSIRGNVETARQVCKDFPACRFQVADLNLLPAEEMASLPAQRYDIVLALGIMHKLADPGAGVRYAAWSSRNLVLFRSGKRAQHGIIVNKWNSKVSCDAHAIMREQGFALEQVVEGPPPHSESVEYWRRTA